MLLVSLTSLIFLHSVFRSAELKYLLPRCSAVLIFMPVWLGNIFAKHFFGSALLWLMLKCVPHHWVGVWKFNMSAWDSRHSLCLSVSVLEKWEAQKSWWVNLALKLCEIWICTRPAWCIISLAFHDMNDYHLSNSLLVEIHRPLQLQQVVD